MTQTRLVEVRQNVLKHNDVLARDLRIRFEEAGVFVASFVSSPGSGKTAFLEKTLTMLRPNYRVAALVGDLATENDAARLARAEVLQYQTIQGSRRFAESQRRGNNIFRHRGADLNCKTNFIRLV
jgi:hydrogenase nickel incorporation protein HypB